MHEPGFSSAWLATDCFDSQDSAEEMQGVPVLLKAQNAVFEGTMQAESVSQEKRQTVQISLKTKNKSFTVSSETNSRHS